MNTENKLRTLDGLIERLIELRESAGCDCPVVLGKSFDSTKERLIITMTSLDLSPQTRTQQVAILAEPERYLDQQEQKRAFLEHQTEQFRRAFFEEQNEKKQVEEQPEHSFMETIYRCGKKPHWNIGDTLACYEFTSDCEGEIVLGKVTNVELDEEYEDWLYTFENGYQEEEESLLRNETYKKSQRNK